MTREKFISYFFIVLLIFVVYQVILIFSPFFHAIFWSAILSFSFYPAYVYLKRLIPSETGAAILMTALIFLLVIPPVVLLIISMTDEAVELYQTTSNYIKNGGLETLLNQIRSWSLVQSFEAKIGYWEPLKHNASEWLLSSARNIGNFAAAQAGTLTKNIFLIGLNTVLMTFLIFIFLKDGRKIYNFIYQIAPLDEKHKKPIFERISETFAAVIRGQLLTGIVQAITAGFGFWLIGIPVPIFFAAITFIAALIPVVGASTVWVPLTIYLFTLNHKVQAVILLAFGICVISLVDNILKPMIIGEKTKLPYFMLFFGILGGLKLYGLMGVFLAPAMLSLFFALTQIYQEKNW